MSVRRPLLHSPPAHLGSRIAAVCGMDDDGVIEACGFQAWHFNICLLRQESLSRQQSIVGMPAFLLLGVLTGNEQKFQESSVYGSRRCRV